MHPETIASCSTGEAAAQSGRAGRSRQHAARALDPQWVGWHVPEETPRRAEPGEGRRGPVAGHSRQHAAKRSTAGGRMAYLAEHARLSHL